MKKEKSIAELALARRLLHENRPLRGASERASDAKSEEKRKRWISFCNHLAALHCMWAASTAAYLDTSSPIVLLLMYINIICGRETPFSHFFTSLCFLLGVLHFPRIFVQIKKELEKGKNGGD